MSTHMMVFLADGLTQYTSNEYLYEGEISTRRIKQIYERASLSQIYLLVCFLFKAIWLSNLLWVLPIELDVNMDSTMAGHLNISRYLQSNHLH